MEKTSPGPWKWDSEAHSQNVLRASNGVSVALLDARVTVEGGEAMAGDRTLIASAPEMREMLLGLETRYSVDRVTGRGRGCPHCRYRLTDEDEAEIKYPHAPDCKLAALLERLR